MPLTGARSASRRAAVASHATDLPLACYAQANTVLYTHGRHERRHGALHSTTQAGRQARGKGAPLHMAASKCLIVPRQKDHDMASLEATGSESRGGEIGASPPSTRMGEQPHPSWAPPQCASALASRPVARAPPACGRRQTLEHGPPERPLNSLVGGDGKHHEGMGDCGTTICEDGRAADHSMYF